MNRNQLLKEVCTLAKELNMPKSELPKMCKLSKHDLTSTRETLIKSKNVDHDTADYHTAEFDTDYSMMKLYYKQHRETALLLKY